MNFLSTLLVEIPAKSLIESSRSWIPFYGAILITLITAFGNWWRGRSKTKHDQFQIFMDESAEYREEMRKEFIRLKKEVSILEEEKLIFKKQISDYIIQLENSTTNIAKVDKELLESKHSLELAQQKLIALKERAINHNITLIKKS